MRLLIAILPLALFIASCDEPTIRKPSSKAWVMPNETESTAIRDGCNNKILCLQPKWYVRLSELNVGRQMGGGAVLREARTNGNQIILRWDLPKSYTGILDENGFPISQTSHEAYLAEYLKNNFCDNQGGRAFLTAGGEVILETYLPSGKRYTRSVTKSC